MRETPGLFGRTGRQKSLQKKGRDPGAGNGDTQRIRSHIRIKETLSCTHNAIQKTRRQTGRLSSNRATCRFPHKRSKRLCSPDHAFPSGAHSKLTRCPTVLPPKKHGLPSKHQRGHPNNCGKASQIPHGGLIRKHSKPSCYTLAISRRD